MLLNCPNCGSKYIRHSHYQTFGERLMSFFGVHQLRCKDCQHRFSGKIFRAADWWWSKCPRCYRMDLSSWNEEHYLPKWRTKMMLRFGAKRLRCEYCRLNFAGWRPVKMRYQWRRRKKDDTLLGVAGEGDVQQQNAAVAAAGADAVATPAQPDDPVSQSVARDE